MSYFGAKNNAGVFQAIIALMPPHEIYLEPFAGSGAILRRKAPAAHSIVIDMDKAALASISARYKAEKVHGNALDYLEAYAPAPDARTVIYADPPYVHSTRTGLDRHRYRHEMTDADHERMATALQRLGGQGCAVIVSGYPSALYDRLFTGWRTLEMQSPTRGGIRTEKLWFNFEPSAAHWATYAGENFTDRQRIKRKAARWAAQFKALPAGERQAVLAAILSAETRPT